MGELIRGAVLQNIDGTERFQLDPSQTYAIGRGEQASLRVKQASVSRVHAMIFWDGRHWVIVDCSSYGTSINGRPVQKHRLGQGDLIRLAEQCQFTFSEEAIDEPQVKITSRSTNNDALKGSWVQAAEESEWQIIGSSPSMHALRTQILKAAQSTVPILIRGEFGVGKRHVARALHAASKMNRRPFAALDCRAINASGLRARFSRAILPGESLAERPGTIMLDRVGMLNSECQKELLTHLQEMSRLSREGDLQDQSPQVIAISESPLEDLVDSHAFDGDLLARLTVFQILVDPLREHVDDIPELARYFSSAYARRYGKTVRFIPPEAISALKGHDWPANIRELRNTIERAVMLSTGGELDSPSLSRGFTEDHRLATGLVGLSLEEMEKRHISETLESTNWKKSRTAEILRIERSTLDRKIKRYGLRRPQFDVGAVSALK